MPTLLQLNLQENLVTKPKSLVQIIPFWIVLLSIFIYIFKFDVLKYFNASHSNIFYTTKFWFLVSNTIILIIAADFSVFCSSTKDDLYKDNYEYHLENYQVRSLPLLKLHTPKIVESVCSNQAVDQFHQEVKDIVVYKETKSSKYTIANNKPNSDFQETNILHQLASKTDHKDGKNEQEKKKESPGRVLSMPYGYADVAIKDHNEKKMNVLHRSKTEKIDINGEENEFSSMSNEELNKRVEEFIERCNRQIRSEAVARRTK